MVEALNLFALEKLAKEKMPEAACETGQTITAFRSQSAVGNVMV
jgi:hypothetical protein